MSGMLIVLALAAASADRPAVGSVATGERSATLRRLSEIDKEVAAAMREQARAETKAERAAAIRELTRLYVEIKNDPRLENSDILKACKARLWSRLTRVQKDLRRELDRAAKAAARDPAAAELHAIREASDSLASQMSLTNYSLGGPGYVFQQAGGALGGGTQEDYGEELIELIQRTIAPTFWDTAGGPGSMFYFKPLMALVVSATAEVHDNVGGLLGALRRVSN